MTVEVEFNRGYTFGEWLDGIVLRWGGVQTEETNIENSSASDSIDMPGIDWFEDYDRELYLIIPTQALPMFDVNVLTDGHGSAGASPNPALGGEEVTLTAAPDAGYRFKEWQSTDVTITDSKFTMSAKAVSVTAVFEAIPSYTVTFNMNGHGKQIPAQTVEEGSKATKPTDPAETGWTFGGWYKDSAFSAAFDFNTAIRSNATIYAKWTPIYTIISGANGEWTKSSTSGLSFTSDAPFSKFYSVMVDGSTIAASNHTAEKGSTKITLTPEYLESLSLGYHIIRVVSIDGSASTHFRIKAAPKPTDPVNPKTGDNSNMLLWLMLLAASGTALTGAAIYSRRKRHN